MLLSKTNKQKITKQNNSNFLEIKEGEACSGKCHFFFFIVDAHTETYGTVRGKKKEKRLKMHRYFIMHGGDMHMTKVLILPSEVPRGANMLSESSMCYIFLPIWGSLCALHIFIHCSKWADII